MRREEAVEESESRKSGEFEDESAECELDDQSEWAEEEEDRVVEEDSGEEEEKNGEEDRAKEELVVGVVISVDTLFELVPFLATKESPQRRESIELEREEFSSIPIEAVDVDSGEREQVRDDAECESESEESKVDDDSGHVIIDWSEKRHVSRPEVYVIEEEMTKRFVQGSIQLQPSWHGH